MNLDQVKTHTCANSAICGFMALFLVTLAPAEARALEVNGFGTKGKDELIELVVETTKPVAEMTSEELRSHLEKAYKRVAFKGEEASLRSLRQTLVNQHDLTVSAGAQAITTNASLFSRKDDDKSLLTFTVTILPITGSPDDSLTRAHEAGHRALDKRVLETLDRHDRDGNLLSGEQRRELQTARQSQAIEEFHNLVGANPDETEALVREGKLEDAGDENELRANATQSVDIVIGQEKQGQASEKSPQAEETQTGQDPSSQGANENCCSKCGGGIVGSICRINCDSSC